MRVYAEILKKIEWLKAEAIALESAEIMIDMGREEEDEDAFIEVKETLDAVEERMRAQEIDQMLDGEHDRGAAWILIRAGAGGAESQDWASMLFRMVLRYCERQGREVNIVDYQAGEEVGIRSALIEVGGRNAYGYLKGESGVHRLVWVSPYDPCKRRHISFASLLVFPVIDDTIEAEIKASDLEVYSFHARGSDGRHVINKSGTAVRVLHVPTGIVVSCKDKDSQHNNRATALKILRARIYEKKKSERRAQLGEADISEQASNFGDPIRSYVLHPYERVKDHRTGVSASNVSNVLDGDLNQFIAACLMLVEDKEVGSSKVKFGSRK